MVKTKQKRGRPRKEFKPLPRDKSIKRERGRPRKQTQETVERITSVMNNEQWDVRFANHKIIKTNKGTNFTAWLLIFSILILLFSLYKTFVKEVPEVKQIPEEVVVQTTDNTIQPEIVVETTQVSQQDTIIAFYNAFNNKDTKQLFTLSDAALRETNTFNNYFTNNRINRFLWGLANNKVYISSIQKWETENQYVYTIKYKLQNLNTLFEEQRKVVFKEVEWIFRISSIRCINTWCSKLPFFNPGKYWL